jgi:hypothetical protein
MKDNRAFDETAGLLLTLIKNITALFNSNLIGQFPTLLWLGDYNIFETE